MTWHLCILSYLCSYFFWLEINLGLMGILMIGNLTGGKWFTASRSVLLGSLRSLELLALLFLPIAFSLAALYPWFTPSAGEMSVETTMQKAFFFNPAWFRWRALSVWILWLIIARVLRSSQGRRPLWSGLGLMIMLFTYTAASTDWLMSLDPTWSSVGFGTIALGSALVAGFSFLTVAVVSRVSRSAPLIDYGNLLLMAVLFWAYVKYLAYLIIWSGQIPGEMHWYQARAKGIFAGMLVVMALVGFALPMAALLFRRIKLNPKYLMVVAALLLVVRWLESFWLTFPGQSVDPILAIVATFVLTLAIGCGWFVFYQRGSYVAS